jgi:hypothetical protein
MHDSARAVADELCQWFRSILHVADERVFGIAPDGPHREAVILDVMRRNARVLFESDLDRQGKLYTPLCLFLSAGCRRLNTSLGTGHWRAALDNVTQLQRQLEQTHAESATVGLDIGSPAALFKQQLDEALNQAGLAGRVTYLDRPSRDVAVGLAVNWGMRFLLAYALDSTHAASRHSRKDLSWIANLVESYIGPIAQS